MRPVRAAAPLAGLTRRQSAVGRGTRIRSMKRSTSPSRLRIRLPTAPAGLARRARLPSRSRSASSMSARGARGSFLPQNLRQHLVQAVWQDAELGKAGVRSEEHTSELQSLMRIPYAVFCLKKQNTPRLNDIVTT